MNKILISAFSLLVIAVVLAGCQQASNQAPNITLSGAVITTGNNTQVLNQSQMAANTSNSSSNMTGQYGNVSKVITGTEGDLIKLDVKAYSPDGLPLTYTYSPPFNDQGLWQTKDGDAGKYLVSIVASDGKLTATASVLVIVNPRNQPPVIDCPTSINVKEGDTVNLNCNFYDKENDPIVVDYSGWMNSPTYTTNYESSGDHKVQVRASDPFGNTTKIITVHVENVDRAPVFLQHLKDLTVTESDIIALHSNVTDPDTGDVVTLTYSTPLDHNGIWKTQVGDAGTYPISVVASDGTLSTKESFTLTVKMLNTPPMMKLIPNITVFEGDTVTIKPDVKDREGDPITIKYTGWITSSSYTTTYDDAYPNGCDTRGCSAVYKVTVTASDGVFNVSQDVYITVTDKDRPPVFVFP